MTFPVQRVAARRPALSVEALETRDVLNATYFSLASGNLAQDWSSTSLITTNNNWNNVPSIIGYSGAGLAAGGADARTVLAPGVATNDLPAGVVNVTANQGNPNTFAGGGTVEFDGIANPTVALRGSGTANAPFLLLHLDATARRNVQVGFNVRDLDGTANDAAQQVVVQYRVGTTGNFINVPGGYVADATDANAATRVTPVSVTLPEAVYNQPQVQVRILTVNAVGANEAIGIDDIVVSSFFSLASGDLTQSWGNTNQITADNNWNGVPGIVGYSGAGLTTVAGTDARTVLAPGVAPTDTPAGVVNVTANQGNPNTFAGGGAVEFDGIANPTVALQGSNTASAPFLLLNLDTTARRNVQLSFNVRDLDGTANDAAQQVVVQYRVGTTGNFINVPGGYVADATDANAATRVTPVSVTLPAEAHNQRQVQVRILTVNAVGNDEAIGIDDIAVSSVALPVQPLAFTLDPANSSLVLSGSAGTGTIVQQAAGSLTTTFSGPVQAVLNRNAPTETLNFVGTGTAATAANSGSWTPRAGGLVNADPANYGGRVDLGFLGNFDLAVRNLVASLSTTAPLSLSLPGAMQVQSFASTQLVSLTTGAVDFRGLVSGSSTSGTTPLAGQSINNTSTTAGSFVDNGNDTYSLTLPVTAPFTLTQPVAGQSTTLRFTGTLLGTAAPVVIDLNGAGVGRDVLVAFTEDVTPGAIAPALTLTGGAAGNITGAKVKLLNNPEGVMEGFDRPGAVAGLTSTYNPSTGELTVTGSAPAATYETFLRGVRYLNDSNTPNTTNRLVEFSLTGADGGSSTIQTAVVTVATTNDPPVVAAPSGTQTILRNTSLTFATASNTGITLSDLDAGTNPVAVVVDATNGTVALSGTAGLTGVTGNGGPSVSFAGPLSAVNAALNGLVFTPTTGFLGAASVTVSVNDQGNTGGPPQSGSATVNITVAPQNLAPANTVPGAQTTAEDTALTFSGVRTISVSDPDAGSSPVEVTLTATGGTVTLSGTTGLTFTTGDGTADAAMTFTGTLSAINTALNGLQFAPNANFNGPASLQIVTDDLGNTGFGGPLDDFDTIAISVTAVNDPPVANADSVIVAQNAVPTPIAVLANDVDVDSPISITAVTTPSAGGSVTLSGGQIIYTPATTFTGTETFTYTISDGQFSATATVTVTVPPALPAPAQFIAIGSDAGVPGVVRLLGANTRDVVRDIVPFVGYTGGLRVALGDINGDGQDDVVVATASGLGHVKVFDGRTNAEIRSFLPFANFPSGLNVSTGDLDADGFDDIIVGILSGPAHVQAFSGRTGEVLQSFIAFEGFLGGVRVAAGDVNGDGRDDIAVVAGPGGNGHIKAFDVRSLALLTSYLSYVNYLGEVNIAAGDVNGDGFDEVVTTALDPANGTNVLAANQAGNPVRAFFAPTPAVTGRVPSAPARVGVADVNGDGLADILLGDAFGTASSLLVIVGGKPQQQPLDIRAAFDPRYNLGIYVA